MLNQTEYYQKSSKRHFWRTHDAGECVRVAHLGVAARTLLAGPGPDRARRRSRLGSRQNRRDPERRHERLERYCVGVRGIDRGANLGVVSRGKAQVEGLQDPLEGL